MGPSQGCGTPHQDPHTPQHLRPGQLRAALSCGVGGRGGEGCKSGPRGSRLVRKARCDGRQWHVPPKLARADRSRTPGCIRAPGERSCGASRTLVASVMEDGAGGKPATPRDGADGSGRASPQRCAAARFPCPAPGPLGACRALVAHQSWSALGKGLPDDGPALSTNGQIETRIGRDRGLFGSVLGVRARRCRLGPSAQRCQVILASYSCHSTGLRGGPLKGPFHCVAKSCN